MEGQSTLINAVGLLLQLQIDPQSQLMSGLAWLGGGLVALLTTIGAGSIILAILKRRWDREDKRETTQDAATAERIKVEGSISEKILQMMQASEDRLNKKIEKLESELGSLREMNARKDAKIEHLEEENKSLRDRVRDQDRQIVELRKEIEALTARLIQLEPQRPQLLQGGKT